MREGHGWELVGGDGPSKRDRDILMRKKWEENLHIILSRSREEFQEAALMLKWMQWGVIGQLNLRPDPEAGRELCGLYQLA